MDLLTAAAVMMIGGYTSQPIGHYDFCINRPAECRANELVDPIVLDEATLTRIIRVNREINRSISPMSDMDVWGRSEVWSRPVVTAKGMVGDCEDYVLEKRAALADLGLGNLLITVVYQRDNTGHAVLTIRTDRGDLILDNLTDDVRWWTDAPYLFRKRQSSEHSGRWRDIEPQETS